MNAELNPGPPEQWETFYTELFHWPIWPLLLSSHLLFREGCCFKRQQSRATPCGGLYLTPLEAHSKSLGLAALLFRTQEEMPCFRETSLSLKLTAFSLSLHSFGMISVYDLGRSRMPLSDIHHRMALCCPNSTPFLKST